MGRDVNLTSILLFSILLICNGSSNKGNNGILAQKNQERLSVIEWENLLQNGEPYVSLRSRLEVNGTCSKELNMLKEALFNGTQLWASKMLDASSKLPSGILEGNIIDLGMYDECVGIQEKLSDSEIQGLHCMYRVTISSAEVSLSPTMSVCVPASCTESDISDFLAYAIHESKDALPNSVKIKLNSVTCSTIHQDIWDLEFIICFSLFSAFIGFLIICTACDIINKYTISKSHKLQVFINFSLLKNGAAILSTEVKRGNLPAIHGLRSISMCWVVLGHQYVQQFMGPNVNAVHVPEWIKSWNSLYIFVAPFAVDTFFTLSGFLMTYLFLKQIPKQKTFNVPKYYLHRYFRLTPSVIVLIVVAVVFVPKIGSGPRWDTIVNLYSAKCRTKWWPTLLYVQNLVQKNDMVSFFTSSLSYDGVLWPESVFQCLPHLWYLAVDMQLFWISPIILYPLYKYPKIGIMILSVLSSASLVIPTLIVGINKYRMVSFTGIASGALKDIFKPFKEVYVMAYCRAAPWLFGVWLGLEVVQNNRRLNKSVIIAGWMLTVAAFTFCTLGTRYFMDPNYKYEVIIETLFSTISKPVWAFGICWIIYASIRNCAGPISTFLSWSFFLPISRLSYCIYLVHFVIQTMQVAATRTPRYFSDYYVWNLYLSDLIISIVAAFFFSLLFESPLVALEKMILGKNRECENHSSKKPQTIDGMTS